MRMGKTSTDIVIGIVVTAAIVVALIALVLWDWSGDQGSGLGKEFVYDIEEIAKIDPKLRIYDEAGLVIKTGLKVTTAISLDAEGRVYVVGDNAIHQYSSDGKLTKKISLGGKPTCFAIDNDGKYYIGMKDHVEVYDSEGIKITSWASLGERSYITSVAVGENDVFAADAGNRVVVRYDKEGNIKNMIGKKDLNRNVPGFSIPSPYFDLAIGGDGLIRVVNPGRHRIEAYTFDGDLEFWWGKFGADIEGFCGCCNPINFAILADEGFVTIEKGLVRAKEYDKYGEFRGVVAGPRDFANTGGTTICDYPENCQTGGFDIAADLKGRVYVLDTLRNIVKIFNRRQSN
jgi:hypothetical protein